MQNEIKIGTSLLETITVALYEDPIILFREYVQNSLDAYNLAIEKQEKIDDFGVSININRDKRKIIIRDNGYGIESKMFDEKMLSIASSEKANERTKYIGFRGIGRISGLPFCEKLIFKNKMKNSTKINICTWNGDKYIQLLREQSKDDLQDTIRKIVEITNIKDEDIAQDEHFFEVIIDKYNDELGDLISKDTYFKMRLSKMLPLKYSPKFTKSELITNEYKKFMKEDLKRFMITVKYNGEELLKNYTNDYIKESGIAFWRIRGKMTKSGGPGTKIGLLWFTFDRRLTSTKDRDYFGILVRSKNMLMGGNETIAQVTDRYCDITSYSEIIGSLRAIHGELLINSPDLKDNARRDWFRYDNYSRDLNYIICDFIQRLHNYRYKASKYFRKYTTMEEESMVQALDELVDLKRNKIDFKSFYKKEEEQKLEYETFADQDIPNEGITFKKIYNKIMNVIKEFFDKDKDYDIFFKLRAFIVKKLGKNNTKG